MKKNRKKRLWALLLAAVLMASPAMAVTAEAASSAQIREEIDGLEAEQEAMQDQLDKLQAEQNANWESIEEMVAYKNNIDAQIFLLHSEIDNITKQIASYRTLIAQTQEELDIAEANLEALNTKYKERIRAMEEEGEITYWMVIFKATSFTDLIDRLNMIDEIAQADQRMLAELETAALEVSETKTQLQSEKAALEESLKRQQAAQAEIAAMREEADAVLVVLNSDRKDMEELRESYEDTMSELSAEIAAAEEEYNEAKRKEEEASRPTVPPANDNGWMAPVAYTYVSSPYGYRLHPITGNPQHFHDGVDFPMASGTPIYATRSGTVTTATYHYAWGNYVVINHGDGFSSLYAHMTHYVVSYGQYVTQGQVIGYVGSTGYSTGPHLHFSIYYNGSSVNPMNYV